jgi:hypothetical protein
MIRSPSCYPPLLSGKQQETQILHLTEAYELWFPNPNLCLHTAKDSFLLAPSSLVSHGRQNATKSKSEAGA